MIKSLKILALVVLHIIVMTGTACAEYNAGFVWNRSADWQDGIVVNTTTGNPCNDSQGNPVWRHESLQITGGLSSASPWYKGDGTLMNWNVNYQGGNEWARGTYGGSPSSQSPLISGSSIIWNTYHCSGSYAPAVTWTSPISGKISLSGTYRFGSSNYVIGSYTHWNMTNWTQTGTINVNGVGGPTVIAKKSASTGVWTILASTNIAFAADGTSVDWNLTGLDNISVAPGDQIRFTFIPSDWAAFDDGNWAGDNWFWAGEKSGAPVNITLLNVDYCTPLATGEVAIAPNKAWTAVATIPSLAVGEVPVLRFIARLNTPTLGGCNVINQVLIDGVSIANDSILQNGIHPRIRLLNKMPSCVPPGSSYNIEWYHSGHQAWTTVFSPTFSGDWCGTGHDFEYILDLTGMVVPGRQTEISFSFINGHIVNALSLTEAQIANAKLILDQVAIGKMAQADVLSLNSQVQGWASPTSVTVDPNLPANATPGEKPYEIVWSGRTEPANTQVAFDNLAGWTMSACGDASVGLFASVEQQLWRSQLAKFTYGGGTTDTTVIIEPPSPIAISGSFDAVNLWMYGGYDRDADTTALTISAIIEDSVGREFAMKCTPVRSTYWNIQHGILSANDLAIVVFPMKFKRLVITNCKASGSRTSYLESMSFYTQNRQPEQWTRPADAAFPLTDNGVLPTSPAISGTTCTPVGQGADFTSTGDGGTLKFMVRPQDGVLNGITAQWNSGTVFRPMSQGCIVHDFYGDPSISQPDNGTITSSTLTDGKLSVTWTYNGWTRPVVWQADYSISGRTLVVDVKCQGGTAKRLSFGSLSGLSNPRGIEVPYMLFSDKPGPRIACAENMFVSILPDWYNSDFTLLDTTFTAATANSIGLMGGTVYEKLSNGTRNNLSDRVLITVSPKFEDTLPNSQNPVSANRDDLAKNMFFMSAQWCPNYWKTLKDYGVDHVIANSFSTVYVRSFFEDGYIRWRPRPDATEAQLKAYFDGIRALGYIPGTYMCATLNTPVNEYWNENHLCTWADGNWIDGWYGAFSTNPSVNAALVRAVGEQVKQKSNAGCVFLDTYTCNGLVDYTYEAGAGGAAMARHRVIGLGDGIVEARKWYGSTISEGYNRCLYAGLTDMDYATIIGTSTASEMPLLVDYDLLKIHPYEIGTMMGWGPGTFLSSTEAAQLVSSDDGLGVGSTIFHKYVSASLAYGHSLMLGYDYWPPLSRLLQYYGIFQGVQSEYLTDNVSEIRYHNGTDFITTSQMLKDGLQGNGRVKVTYSRGLVVYVNYNATNNWTVTANGRSYVLPPYGWVIVKPGEILSYSALVNGNRVDYVQTPDYYYMNTGTSTVVEGPIDLNGAVYVKHEGNEWRVIPCGNLGTMEGFRPTDPAVWLWDYRLINTPANKGCSRIVLNATALCGNVTHVLIKSISDSGSVVSSEVRPMGNGFIELSPVSGVKEYRIQSAYDMSGNSSNCVDQIRKLTDGTAIGIADAQVTRDIVDSFYIETTDRASGIRVIKPTGTATLAPGSLVSIAGSVTTNSDGERCISATQVSAVAGISTISPLGVINKSIGGAGIAGQVGSNTGVGLNNVGLLVRAWGKPALVVRRNDQFTISDGSGSSTLVILPVGYSHGWSSAPSYVTVTGVASLKYSLGIRKAVIRIAGMSDVRVN